MLNNKLFIFMKIKNLIYGSDLDEGIIANLSNKIKQSFGSSDSSSEKLVTDQNGAKVFVKGKKIHREGGPAVLETDGTLKWMVNGKYHREDGPAIISPDGTAHWMINGKHHRENGPAYVGFISGRNWELKWIKNGVLNRYPEPAVVSYADTPVFYYNGKRVSNLEGLRTLEKTGVKWESDEDYKNYGPGVTKNLWHQEYENHKRDFSVKASSPYR